MNDSDNEATTKHEGNLRNPKTVSPLYPAKLSFPDGSLVLLRRLQKQARKNSRVTCKTLKKR